MCFGCLQIWARTTIIGFSFFFSFSCAFIAWIYVAFVASASTDFFVLSVLIPEDSDRICSVALFDTISIQIYNLASMYWEDTDFAYWYFSTKSTCYSIRLTGSFSTSVNFAGFSTFADSKFTFHIFLDVVTCSSMIAPTHDVSHQTIFTTLLSVTTMLRAGVEFSSNALSFSVAD